MSLLLPSDGSLFAEIFEAVFCYFLRKLKFLLDDNLEELALLEAYPGKPADRKSNSVQVI